MCMCYVRLLLTKNPTLNPTGRDKKIERENPHGYTQVCTQLLLIFDLVFSSLLVASLSAGPLSRALWEVVENAAG